MMLIWVSRGTLEIMLFVRPTGGHDEQHRVNVYTIVFHKIFPLVNRRR